MIKPRTIWRRPIGRNYELTLGSKQHTISCKACWLLGLFDRAS